MISHNSRAMLGVLGGMGPMASAEFLKSIYELSGDRLDYDQDSPRVILYSDPTFPDRTEAFLKGDDEPLLDQLIDALNQLLSLGASHVVICCMTIHYLLPRLPHNLRARVISLLDVIYTNFEQKPDDYLVICSTGTRKLGLFESHPAWPRAKGRLVFPDQHEQARMHELIYEVKRNRKIDEAIAFVQSLLNDYHLDSFIAGCSEVHMLAKQFMASPSRQAAHHCIDPLAIITKQVVEQCQ